MTHTPGPWDQHIRLDTDDRSDPRGCYLAIGSDAWGEFAKVVVRMSHKDEDSQMGLANARLISAAPDLLEVLEALVSTLSANDEDGLTEFAEPMVAARAAIAKARGA